MKQSGLRGLLVAGASLLLAHGAQAQLSFNGTYSESFNGMGTSGTTAPSGWTAIGVLGGTNTSWASSIPASGAPSAATAGTANATLVVSTGTSGTSNSQAYNMGASGNSDRALGTSPTSGAGTMLQLRLTNNTGDAINSIRVGYDVRRFTNPTNELPGYWLFYSTNNGSTWTEVTALRPSATTVPNSVGVSNFAPALINLASPVAAGAELRLRWVDDNAVETSPDQIIGLDNLSIVVPVPNTLPTVVLTAPTAGTPFDAPASINLTATAADSDGTISKVEFFNGTTKLGEDTTAPYELAWNGVISGAYSLTAVATDNLEGTTTSAAVNVTVTNTDNVGPTVALTAPVHGGTLLTSSTTITASASDSDGVVSKVEFYNGATKLGEDSSSPYSFNWTGLSTGNHTLTAVATDNDGGVTTSSPVNVTVAAPITRTLISKGSAWKYLDNGSDQGTAWKETTFSDAAWASGTGPLGGGDSHIVTTVNIGPSGGRYITTYFRRSFTANAAAAIQGLNMNILRDDGVVVYINGTEVARHNLPAGAINYLTDTPDIVDGANESTYFPATATPFPVLVEGQNTIAVEVHQRDGNSSDLGFDLELIALSLPGTAPAVAITAPAANATFDAPATININADATDSDGTVAKVEFFNGATKLGEDTSAPYAFEWSSVAQGAYSFTARATDNVGLVTTSDAVTVTVNPPSTMPPVVVLTSPVNNAAFIEPAAITLTASASDSDGTVAKVEFYNGATKLGEDTSAPYTLEWSAVPAGSHTLTAKATDNLTAASTSASITISVNPNQAPTIALLSPADAATGLGSGGTVNLTATMGDAEGQPLTVTFYGRPQSAPPGEDFTLMTLPDTQFYSENSGGNRFQLFENQTNWIVSARDTLNIAFVAHMGDMVQNGDSVTAEWQRASQAMSYIENPTTTQRLMGIPWGGAPGNHDGGGSTWNTYFGSNRWLDNGRTYFQGNYNSSNTNNYQFFSAGGMDFIVINLAYNSSTSGNQAVMNWADALLKANPTRRAIVTSHWLVGTSFPPTQAAWGGHGQAVYDNLKDNPNLFLMLCGHIHGEGRRADTFEGRTVNTVLQDYQSRSNGGDSWLRYFTFKPAENKIYAYTYKTNASTFETDADSQFTLDYNMAATAPWTPLGTVSVATGATSASLAWTGLTANTGYEWYAAVTDGVTPVGSAPLTFTTTGNAAPTVALTSPANGATIELPATVSLTANAADLDGGITRVEFYHGTTKLGEDTTAPYAFDWTAPVGTHTVSARAFDLDGTPVDSAAATITVTDPRPIVSIISTDDGASENGADQTLVFAVGRTGPTTAALTVNLTAGGTATSGADYSGLVSPLVIPAGSASATLTITILPDALSEDLESVVLTVAPDSAYQLGTPASVIGSIADRPAHEYYVATIPDPAKRGPADDADGDSVPNAIEYFMGSQPGNGSSGGGMQPQTGGSGAGQELSVSFPRAKNRDISGALQWSANLTHWYNGGESDGVRTVIFTETVVSPPGADPEQVQTSVSHTGGDESTQIFVRLKVQ
ncbi:MAG: Ig-like domain-containing protein [Prosthecobacter sp.]